MKLWRNHVDSVPKLCDDYTALLCIPVVNYAEHERWVPALKMYRAIFLVILCCLLLGINTYGWRSSGVNHVLIFELDPRNHLTHSELLEVRKLPCESKLVLIAKVWIGTILKPVRWKYSNHRITVNYALLFKFQIAGLFAVIWAVSLLGFLFSNYISIPEFASPLVLFGLCVLFLLNPFRIMYYKARWWLLRILVSTWTAFGKSQVTMQCGSIEMLIKYISMANMSNILLRLSSFVLLRHHFTTWGLLISGWQINLIV